MYIVHAGYSFEREKGKPNLNIAARFKTGFIFVCLVGLFFYLLSRTARAQIDPGEALAISQGPLMGVIIFSLRELTV